MRKAIEKKYEILDLLGKGSYGYVSKGKCKASGRMVALKVIESLTNTEYDKIKLIREIKIMKRL
jgi:serine/threonine protein kinase